MNKKGFTLAELLGVIVILGIIGMISIGVIERNIKEGRYKTCKAQEKNIIEGAKMWKIDNPADETNCVKISVLKQYGYIDEDLKNPVTEEDYNSDTCVNINTNNYTVTYVTEKGCE
ncbi:MAG: prepilin-type N-terminal cleavage/methylation domain-containing protein [Bacilli bacterium]|nr:prepilin-type N-terminal cleavage/methylation domain-containing protein [Bacilli bacterium]